MLRQRLKDIFNQRKIISLGLLPFSWLIFTAQIFPAAADWSDKPVQTNLSDWLGTMNMNFDNFLNRLNDDVQFRKEFIEQISSNEKLRNKIIDKLESANISSFDKDYLERFKNDAVFREQELGRFDQDAQFRQAIIDSVRTWWNSNKIR